MRSPLLRSASILALAASALAAQAQVTYGFVGANGQTFSLTRDAYITSATRFNSFTTSTNVFQAGFFPSDSRDELDVAVNRGFALVYVFGPGSFASNGVYSGTNGNGGTLTVTGQPVPEPATMAALGLGAVAMLRRRKRAA